MVVGLGPAGIDHLGTRAAELLDGAARPFLRTARHPAAARWPEAATFDHLYESGATFDEVYAAMVEELVEAATTTTPPAGPVVYAVPGSPSVAERSVELLRADERVEVTVVPALSFLDLAWNALGLDPLAAGVRLVDAAAFPAVAARETGPFLVGQAWSRHLLSDMKLGAPGDEDVPRPRPVLLHHLGLDDESVVAVDWWELDRTLEPDHLTSVYVPAGGRRAVGEEMARLATLMDTLRERCPWDRAQTHASLMPHLVEECYEVLDALASVDDVDDAAYAHVEEELGDLLFQIVFHARLADEGGHFDLAGVARGVHDKLVHRHPHVFGDVEVTGADQVVANWEAIKKDEKGRRSVTEGIPTGLPALMLTNKLVRKARSVGMDADPDGSDVAETVAVLESLARGAQGTDPGPDDPLAADTDELNRQVGECLFVVASLAQRLGVDAEQALRDRALMLRDEIVAAESIAQEEENATANVVRRDPTGGAPKE
jgi:tetrapyrrole methylase family protein/MazG family protein